MLGPQVPLVNCPPWSLCEPSLPASSSCPSSTGFPTLGLHWNSLGSFKNPRVGLHSPSYWPGVQLGHWELPKAIVMPRGGELMALIQEHQPKARPSPMHCPLATPREPPSETNSKLGRPPRTSLWPHRGNHFQRPTRGRDGSLILPLNQEGARSLVAIGCPSITDTYLLSKAP